MQYTAHETSVVDKGAQIGDGTKIWHFCHISGSAVIGENCILGQNVYIGENVVIGNNVKIQNNVSVYSGVFIEDDVFIGPSVVFTNVNRPRAFIDQKGGFTGTHIEKGVTIGANATIVCGVRIWRYAFVGAGSVVTKNVDPLSLVYGNPAKYRATITREGRH